MPSYSGVRRNDFSGRRIDRDVTRITWDPVMAEKGGYKHFMAKEIHEQPRAVGDTILGRIHPSTRGRRKAIVRATPTTGRACECWWTGSCE